MTLLVIFTTIEFMDPLYLRLLLSLSWILYLGFLYHLYFGFTAKPVKKLDQLPINTTFSLAIFGDCQGTDNPFTSLRPTYFVFNNLLDNINSRLPLATIILGDMVVSGRAYHFYRFRRQLDRLKTPVYPILGNHDLKYQGRAIFTKLFGSAYYSFSVGANTFILLDNAAGFIDPPQMEWLETQLKNNPGNRLYVFLHQPLFDPRPGQSYAMSDQSQANKLAGLFTRAAVTAVFASHLHGYYAAIQDQVSYFVTGGGGSTLTSPQDYYHYLLLHIDQDEFNVEIVKIPARPSGSLLWRWGCLAILWCLLLWLTFSLVR
ncbi:MAG: metallophosphoesterase [bacterium]|nr:metallophosphoesterase [bacterium]